jgi:hypothetical protein
VKRIHVDEDHAGQAGEHDLQLPSPKCRDSIGNPDAWADVLVPPVKNPLRKIPSLP